MAQTYIGAPIRRREDVRFLTGKATFVDDIKLPHMLYAAMLRSTHAHARITAIDTSQALAIPGVVAVFTWRDVAPYVKPIPIRLYPLPTRCAMWVNPWQWRSPPVAMWPRMR